MNLVERGQETKVLQHALSSAFAGEPTFTVIGGGIGSGKTELIHYAAGLAAEAGVSHLRATNSPLHDSVPFGVVRQLLHRPPVGDRVPSSVARKLDDLVDEALYGEGQNPPLGQIPLTLGKELSSALADTVRDTPLLVTVDDIHNADSASLGVLQQVIEGWRGGGLMLVLSQSLHCAPVDPSFHVETLRSRLYARLRLNPLTRDGVRRLLSSHIGESAAERLAADYTDASGGNPLLLRSLIEDAKTTPPAADSPAVGREYQQSVLACLRRCSDTTVEAAQAAAVLATSRRLRSATPLLLEYMFDDGPRSAKQSLTVLEEVGILGPDRTFRLDAARTAILNDLPPERYRDLRVRAVHAMHLKVGQNHRNEAIPNMLGDATSGTWTVGLLLDAAETDLAQDETSSAIAHLELALGVCPDEVERSKVVTGLTRAKWRVDPLTAAQHFDTLLAADVRGDLTSRDSVTLMHHLAWHGQAEKVAEVIERSSAEKEAGQTAEIDSACQLLANTLPGLKPFLNGLDKPFGRRHPGATPLSVRARAGDSLAQLLEGGSRADAISTAEQILRTSRLTDSTLEALEAALLILLSCERFEAARSACDALLEEATKRGVPTWRAVLAAHRAEIALREGDPAAAERLAGDALAVLPPRSWGVAIGAPLGTLVMATTLLGNLDEAAAHLQHEVPDSMYRSRYCLGYLLARGNHYLATGDVQVARADFEFCGALMKGWRMESPGFQPWRSSAAEALAYLGRTREARELLDEQLALADEEDRRVRGITLAMRARIEPVGNRPPLLNEAVELLRASGDRFCTSRAVLELGHTFHALGDERQARLLEERAEVLTTKLRSEQRPAPAPDTGEAPTGASSLTKSERRVAELAAEGLTNREISRRFYITISTVEQHLTNVYRKLNVKTRLALPDGLAGHADAS
ncbi:helix-turn-helix transcriptional regulator [Streptomonospora litoralis]|uniref:HTH-type transcriptional regulator n=1 Tax=Streptomonospora litoralis TaxID=2498135 RepID=A0A4P6Q709_9ACTN|nr:LuxR family transcriptional regulator [Streptomonospora litoralis]QBI54869.1 Putative HTH-type transcriptional regulator [Streptomonospora litoralis]